MAWPKGKPRPDGAGRKKGTPNKATEALEEICARRGLIPFEALIDLYQSAEKDEIKFNCLKELSGFLYAKRKAIEISGENPFADQTTEELEAAVLAKLKEKLK